LYLAQLEQDDTNADILFVEDIIDTGKKRHHNALGIQH